MKRTVRTENGGDDLESWAHVDGLLLLDQASVKHVIFITKTQKMLFIYSTTIIFLWSSATQNKENPFILLNDLDLRERVLC